MSTAIVSTVPFGDFRDINMYKNQTITTKSHVKTALADRKAVGAPIGFQTSHSTIARRNSGTNASILSTAVAAAAISFSHKLNNSILCLNESCNNTSTLSTTTTNTLTNNILSVTSNCIQQQPAGHRKLDRSLSEPVNSAVGLLGTCGGIGLGSGTNSTVIGNGVAVSTQNQGNSSRYKTELCRPYEESGTCKYGDKCQFAHGGHELRTLARHPKYKTELCRTYHTTGFCPYGPRCHFIHNEQEDPKRSNSISSSSSTCSSSSSISGKVSPTPIPRPKALSVGSFSLMSTSSSSDSSPPSSLSESPTNFFDDAFQGFPSSSQPVTPTANNAFTYSTQDFTAALVGNGCRGNNSFNNKFAAQQLLTRAMNKMNLSNNIKQQLTNYESVMDSGCLENSTFVINNLLSNGGGGGGRRNSDLVSPPPPPPSEAAPESPTGIDSIEMDSNGSFDINRSLRLPIFSQLSVCNDE